MREKCDEYIFLVMEGRISSKLDKVSQDKGTLSGGRKDVRLRLRESVVGWGEEVSEYLFKIYVSAPTFAKS